MMIFGPILDGFAWTFNLIGGSTTSLLVTFVLLSFASWRLLVFYRAAHFVPPMTITRNTDIVELPSEELDT